MPNIFYKQCMMTNNGRTMMRWIPENFAIKGKILKIKTEDGWENGWIIDTVFNQRLSSPELEMKE